MTPTTLIDKALQLSNKWPEDKTIPEKFAKMIDEAVGSYKDELIQIAEGLILDAITPEDAEIVREKLYQEKET